MNILIVDDIEANLLLLQAFLSSIENIEIFESLSAEDAIKITAQTPIDLILSDIKMPEMDGFGLAEVLRANPATKDIPFIFISAYSDYEKRGYDFGAIDYIAKPVDGDVLVSKVKNYIKIIALQRSLEAQNNYVNLLLNSSNEVQIIIDKHSLILNYNTQAKNLFENISKGITLFELFDWEEGNARKLKSFINSVSLDPKSTQIFHKKKNHYKVSYKVLDAKQHMISIFDVTQEIKESKRKDAIYNAQTSIVVVTNDGNATNINKAFYDEYPYVDLHDFQAQHRCICELFMAKDGEDFLLEQMDGIPWYRYMALHKDRVHNVCMLNQEGIEKVYEIQSSGNIFEADTGENEEVVVFHDITETRNQKMILLNQSRLAAMGEMLSMIAHQWRQPLTTIVTIHAKMKMKYDMDMLSKEDFYQDLETTKSVVQHLSKTIDMFQDYFKEQDGESVLVGELFSCVFNIILPIFENNEIENIFECENAVCENHSYFLDNRLDQVLLNIYQNATDALKEDTVNTQKKITTRVSLDENSNTVIRIYDNGRGIDDVILDKIFIPYFSTKSKNGSGLGLYMSKEIVETHLKGTLSVCKYEDGACFKITIANKL